MNELFFEIKEGVTGILDDGRDFCIISIPSITMSSNGALHCGDIYLVIDNEPYMLRISEFIEHICVIGTLKIRELIKESGVNV